MSAFFGGVECTYPCTYYANKKQFARKTQPTLCPHTRLPPGPGACALETPVPRVRTLGSPEHNSSAWLSQPFHRDPQSCSRFPDDIIPAGVKSLFGGVFFRSLLFFLTFRPRNQSKPCLLPQHVSKNSRLPAEEARAPSITARAIETLAHGQSPPLGRKTSCTQTRTHFVLNENLRDSLGRELWVFLFFSEFRPLPSLGEFLGNGARYGGPTRVSPIISPHHAVLPLLKLQRPPDLSLPGHSAHPVAPKGTNVLGHKPLFQPQAQPRWMSD